MSRAAILAVGFLVLFVGGGARFAIGLTLKSITEEFAVGRTRSASPSRFISW